MQVFSMDSDHRGNREHDLFPKLMLNVMKLLCTDMQMFDLFENSYLKCFSLKIIE